MAEIKIKEITGSSITVYIADLDTSYDNNDRQAQWYLDSQQYGKQLSIDAHASKGAEIQFTGLKTSTKYLVEVEVLYTDGSGAHIVSLETTITTSASAKWSMVSVDISGELSSKRSTLVETQRYQLFCIAVKFKYNGVAVFSVDDDEHYIDTLLYVSQTLRYNSNGIPQEDIDATGGDGYYELELEVNSGETYYIWLRRFDGSEAITSWYNLKITIDPPKGTTGGFYIYNGRAWVKSTPYIYNGSRWVKCTPYLYDGGWIEGS